MNLEINHSKISIIGLGYVGLPLAVEFAKYFNTVGFDISQERIAELRNGVDRTLEIEDDELKKVLIQKNEGQKGLYVTLDKAELSSCNVHIVTVPTPTDKYNRPVLTPLVKASETVGSVLKRGDVVIYESTVYPGVTEDECIPILERVSGLTYNVDFFAGYSPERINPGDKVHTVTNILKVTSGSTPEVGRFVDDLYNTIITAGTHLAPNIKVAEAAKVIENSQRDINIAFVNELAKIFNLLDIDTQAVLEAAGTKWNFLPFKPGLVGGHCIGVDPYYLAQKAQEVGYHPEIILAGRRLNDGMGMYVANQVVKLMMRKDLRVIDANILVLGFTFKENCPDVRNTRVIDIINELKTFDINVDVYDPWADPAEVKHEYKLDILTKSTPPSLETYDAVILAVAHDNFKTLPLKQSPTQVIYDVKAFLPKELVDGRL